VTSFCEFTTISGSCWAQLLASWLFLGIILSDVVSPEYSFFFPVYAANQMVESGIVCCRVLHIKSFFFFLELFGKPRIFYIFIYNGSIVLNHEGIGQDLSVRQGFRSQRSCSVLQMTKHSVRPRVYWNFDLMYMENYRDIHLQFISIVYTYICILERM
jgi:hypothetical protein